MTADTTTVQRPDSLVGFLTAPKTARWTSRILLILLWQVAGGVGTRVPTPLGTLQFLADEWSRPYERADWSVLNNELVANLLESLRRAGVAFSAVLIVGLVVGYAMGRYWRVQAFLTDLVIIGIALPAFIWALLAVMWFGFSFRAPVFVGFVSATPMLIVNVFQGSLAVPRELRDMSDSYGVPFRDQLRHLVLPSMMGYVVAGFRVAVLAGWGAVSLAEWFGNNQGAGYRAHYWYDTGNFEGLMGWGIVILAVVITVDRTVLERIVRASFKWRSNIGGLSVAESRT
ncbi:MAG TPA: ABC transporter permease subunit [Acidimicrobiia bacterium]